MIFFQNYPFLIPLISVFCAELIKVSIESVRKKHWSIKNFLHSGGMPSGHSSLSGGILYTSFHISGIQSVEFSIATVLAIVVMYDAINLRRQAGKHARVLNTLQKKEKLDERLGHTFMEMLMGFILGIGVAIVLL